MNRRWVLATTADGGLSGLVEALAARGVDLVTFEVMRERPVTDEAAIAGVRATLGEIAFVAFTSRRAPRAFRRAAPDLLEATTSLPAAAVGPSTAAAARREGYEVRVVSDAGGEALGRALAGQLRPGDAVLHPCGRDRRSEFGAALAGTGARVVPLVVYAMEEVPAGEAGPLPAAAPAAVVLTSPRSVRAYLSLSGSRWREVPHIAIGPTTAAAALEAGVPAVAAANPTPESIVEEIWQTCS